VIKQKGRLIRETFRLADVFRRGTDHRGNHAGDRCDRPSAEISRWIGIIAAALGAITAIFVVPYNPVWSLIYIAIAIMVIYGLSAHYDERTA
jgi:hypothetical protein